MSFIISVLVTQRRWTKIPTTPQKNVRYALEQNTIEYEAQRAATAFMLIAAREEPRERSEV